MFRRGGAEHRGGSRIFMGERKRLCARTFYSILIFKKGYKNTVDTIFFCRRGGGRLLRPLYIHHWNIVRINVFFISIPNITSTARVRGGALEHLLLPKLEYSLPRQPCQFRSAGKWGGGGGVGAILQLFPASTFKTPSAISSQATSEPGINAPFCPEL